MATEEQGFGTSLRWWRTTRRYSQLELAGVAEVSSRHLSFLETGRSKPSREMVVHLATVLDLPLRDRNELLHRAGFAPAYPHSDIDGPEMADIRLVLSRILAGHQPNPAVVVDRRGDLVDANDAALSLLAATVGSDSPALLPTINLSRLTLHPRGLRPCIRNWDAVAATVLLRLERETAHRPADTTLAELLDELRAFPGVSALGRVSAMPTGADLLVPVDLVTLDGDQLRLVTTIATIGAPHDVTLDELRLETFFPADEETRERLEAGLDLRTNVR
ncbi:MAG: helix-turn-helix transcriptional regulator [Actinomycetota bacterium]